MGETSSRDKEFVSYLHFDVYMDQLVKKIRANEYASSKLKYVYGIPRGGWPIAVHLSHHLDLDIRFSHPSVGCKIDEVLIVDDIADTGVTLRAFQDYCIATIFYKPRSIIKPQFYIKETTKWVVFPWERIDEVPNRPE